MKTLATSTLTVQAESIRTYAELTNDFNPLHLDPEFAAKTPMGGVIAHGTMSLCLLWQAIFRSFSEEQAASAEIDVRFVKPVRIGETLEAGGSACAEGEGLYDVWVRGSDGTDRVTGTLRVAGAVQ